jgi:hypothetical protein
MKNTGLVLQETPMVVNLPRAGTYSIGADFGEGLNESVVAFFRLGDPGEPDELVAILRRDKETGKWAQDSELNTGDSLAKRAGNRTATSVEKMREQAMANFGKRRNKDGKTERTK